MSRLSSNWRAIGVPEVATTSEETPETLFAMGVASCAATLMPEATKGMLETGGMTVALPAKVKPRVAGS